MNIPTPPARTQPHGRIWQHPQYIWLDDELTTESEAAAFFPADAPQNALFAELRCYDTGRGPAIFRLRDYVDRFLHATRALGVPDLGYDPEKLRAAICNTVQANGYVDCAIQPQLVYRSPMGQTLEHYKPSLGIAARRCAKAGAQIVLRVLTRIRQGELTLVDLEEGSTFTAEQILLVRDGNIYATPGGGMLVGMTRETVLTLARDAGYRVIGAALTQSTIMDAEEVLVCSASLEVTAVAEVDGEPVGPGAVARHLQQLYAETVHGQNGYARRWLDYMDVITVI